MKLNHFTLFCKGWYKKKDTSNPENIWDDVKTALIGDDYQPDSHNDILYIIMNNMTKHFKKDATTFAIQLIEEIHPQDCWKRGYYTKDHSWIRNNDYANITYDYQTAVLYFYISEIRMLDLNITGKMIAPNPKVMELEHKLTKEKRAMFV